MRWRSSPPPRHPRPGDGSPSTGSRHCCKAGRQRNITTKAAEIRAALNSDQLTARPGVVGAYAASVSALVAVITVMVAQTEVLAGQVEQGFGQHPDIEIYRSQPGLGMILGARVLAEFGDDPDRYADAKARKNYSGMSPITRASGTKRVVLARHARNRRLGDALYQQAFCALTSRLAPERSTTATVTGEPPTTKPTRPRQPSRRHPPRLPPPPHRYDENTAWPALSHENKQAADTLRPWDV